MSFLLWKVTSLVHVHRSSQVTLGTKTHQVCPQWYRNLDLSTFLISHSVRESHGPIFSQQMWFRNSFGRPIFSSAFLFVYYLNRRLFLQYFGSETLWCNLAEIEPLHQRVPEQNPKPPEPSSRPWRTNSSPLTAEGKEERGFPSREQ